MHNRKLCYMWNGTMFVDLDWPLNTSSLLSASAELLVFVMYVNDLPDICINDTDLYLFADDAKICKYIRIIIIIIITRTIETGRIRLSYRLSRVRCKIGRILGYLNWMYKSVRSCHMVGMQIEITHIRWLWMVSLLYSIRLRRPY